MIIYSIVPIEVIFQKVDVDNYQTAVTIEYMGEMIEAVPTGNMSYTIMRVLSTSPKAYLRPELQPGKEVRLPINTN